MAMLSLKDFRLSFARYFTLTTWTFVNCVWPVAIENILRQVSGWVSIRNPRKVQIYSRVFEAPWFCVGATRWSQRLLSGGWCLPMSLTTTIYHVLGLSVACPELWHVRKKGKQVSEHEYVWVIIDATTIKDSTEAKGHGVHGEHKSEIDAQALRSLDPLSGLPKGDARCKETEEVLHRLEVELLSVSSKTR